MISGIAASCSQPSAHVSMVLPLNFRRSSIGAARSAAAARSRSSAFAACSAEAFSRSRRASALSALFFVAASARAISALAAFACMPSASTCSMGLNAFMPTFCRLQPMPADASARRRCACGAQLHRKPVQRGPRIGGPAGHAQTLDDAVDPMRSQQQLRERVARQPRQHALEQLLARAQTRLSRSASGIGWPACRRIVHALQGDRISSESA